MRHGSISGSMAGMSRGFAQGQRFEVGDPGESAPERYRRDCSPRRARASGELSREEQKRGWATGSVDIGGFVFSCAGADVRGPAHPSCTGVDGLACSSIGEQGWWVQERRDELDIGAGGFVRAGTGADVRGPGHSSTGRTGIEGESACSSIGEQGWGAWGLLERTEQGRAGVKRGTLTRVGADGGLGVGASKSSV